MLPLAKALVLAGGLYAGLGLLFAIPFVFLGVGRIDPVAREGTFGFRLMILPGVVALWPILAWRWLRGPSTPPDERNPHRDAVRKMRS